MTESSNVTETAEPVEPPMTLDEMRDVARKLVPWRKRFDEIFMQRPTATISAQSGVSESRLWRYRRGQLRWLSVVEYLKLFAVMTMTEIPQIVDDPIKYPETRPRRLQKHQPNPKKEPVPDPFENVTLE